MFSYIHLVLHAHLPHGTTALRARTEARRPRTCGSLACEHGALARLSLSRLLAWSRGPVSRVIQCDHTCGAPARSRTVVLQTESYFLPFDFP